MQYKPFFLLWAVLMGTSLTLGAQNKAEKSILQVLDQQTAAWNRGDLVGFMQGYWESDSLLFIGKNGPTRGHAATLANYQKSYPSISAMGQLTFDRLSLKKVDAHNYFVVGRWQLKRTNGDLSGYFSLWWKRLNGKWVIVADHSS